MVPWLRLHPPSAAGLGSIPGQGTRSRIPQLKIPHATTETQYSQINKNKYFKSGFIHVAMNHVVDAGRWLVTSLKLSHMAFSHGALLCFLPVGQQDSKRNVLKGRKQRLPIL